MKLGIAAKSRATKRIPARKQPEYERLAEEIEQLQREAGKEFEVFGAQCSEPTENRKLKT